MADNKQIIELYSDLAEHPSKDFGWDKGRDNAKAHGYKEEWIQSIDSNVWDFCAAVGNPFSHASIKKGDTVLDLGCGAGVDLLVASHLVGETGSVIGVDITPKMVELATLHAKLLEKDNVTVLQNSFDSIELEDASVDVVISNGAINLTSCKESVFAEVYRVLKDDGFIVFADMIDISEPSCCSIDKSAGTDCSGEEDWANCVAGTLRENELIELIAKAGFTDVACLEHTHYTTAETTKGAVFQARKIAATQRRQQHWEGLFKEVDYTQVLWHQKEPLKSLELIKAHSTHDAKIIDVGCGASFLVDYLLDDGYKNITLLDTSATSLEIVKKRTQNSDINYICSDVLNFDGTQKFDIWHDRAVFHFLLSAKEQAQYFNLVSQHLKKDGYLIISTFHTQGPNACAGLDIVQYDHEKMLSILPSSLELVQSDTFTHITPKESGQEYISFIIRIKHA